MFHTHNISDDPSYLVADYDPFSLTVWLLKFRKNKPYLEHCVRSFFSPEERSFHPRIFERNLHQSCEQLSKIVGTLPSQICLFLDTGESAATSTGYTFSRPDKEVPVSLEEINLYAHNLLHQANHNIQKLWHEESWHPEHSRKLLSLFLSHLSLDKRHHVFPLGKIASQVGIRCLFFYCNASLIDGISRSIHAAGYDLLTCVPLPMIFLNHLCNQKTFLDNHLHIHLWYETTSVILHLGKFVQEVQSIPFGWQVLDSRLAEQFSPLERESLLMGSNIDTLKSLPEFDFYRDFLSASVIALFEKFGLQWSFHEITVSSQWPADIFGEIIKSGWLSPWVQKNAVMKRIGADSHDHWLQYCSTLDPLFSLNPHPLLSLIRSVFISPHAPH